MYLLCCYWSVSSTYTICCFLHIIHACGPSTQFIPILVEISQDHQTFLGFCQGSADSNNEVLYVFTILPFGLSSAPYIFTKPLKPLETLEKHWRIQGTCIAVFLDDGWAIVEDKEGCLVKAQSVRQDLYSAVFVINEEKLVWEPSQVFRMLVPLEVVHSLTSIMTLCVTKCGQRMKACKARHGGSYL